MIVQEVGKGGVTDVDMSKSGGITTSKMWRLLEQVLRA